MLESLKALIAMSTKKGWSEREILVSLPEVLLPGSGSLA